MNNRTRYSIPGQVLPRLIIQRHKSWTPAPQRQYRPKQKSSAQEDASMNFPAIIFSKSLGIRDTISKNQVEKTHKRQSAKNLKFDGIIRKVIKGLDDKNFEHLAKSIMDVKKSCLQIFFLFWGINCSKKYLVTGSYDNDYLATEFTQLLEEPYCLWILPKPSF